MSQSNTPTEIQFFDLLFAGNDAQIRTFIADHPGILDSYNYRSFGATPLTMACFSNRRDLVEQLIEEGVDPNRRSDWNMGPWSPLHCAVYRNDKSLVEFLLASGAELDVHTAAGMGDCSAVARLLDAEPERVVEKGGDGCHPLHFADTSEVAQLLLDRGAEIDGRCIDHYSTPVQYLCSIRPVVARYLLSKGATPDIFSSIICAECSFVEKLLNNDASLIDARINQTFFPPGNGHDVHNILTFTVGMEATTLHAAAKGNRADMVPLLVGHGLSPNVRGGYDQATPLHVAAWNNCVEVAESLLDNGADINIRSGNIHNNSPAGWAIVSGADNVFQMLMDRGAERFEWFGDDAVDALNGRFDQVSSAKREQRQRIVDRLTNS
ncbi:MAG: ankyrin repeat domain-containing protein [Pirellulaceae bacterium]